MTIPHSAQDILERFDAAVRDSSTQGRFPPIPNPSRYPVSNRLSAYADERSWALFIELVTVVSRAPCPVTGGVLNTVHCIATDPLPDDRAPEHNLCPLSEGSDGPAFAINDSDHGDLCIVGSHATTIRVGTQVVPLPRDRDSFDRAGVTPEYNDQLQVHELARVLAYFHNASLFVADSYLLRFLRRPIPLILRLDQWHHPDVLSGEQPSDTVAFRSLAEAIASRDPSRYSASEPENTHWSHWPGAGWL